mmetsp:Transcript_10406/g.39370  ORF Transcript_10406/g.39370 Transcript_10406/m.39370 type:complete len:213 (+) Transcript_10406:1185-1823(+)
MLCSLGQLVPKRLSVNLCHWSSDKVPVPQGSMTLKAFTMPFSSFWRSDSSRFCVLATNTSYVTPISSESRKTWPTTMKRKTKDTKIVPWPLRLTSSMTSAQLPGFSMSPHSFAATSSGLASRAASGSAAAESSTAVSPAIVKTNMVDRNTTTSMGQRIRREPGMASMMLSKKRRMTRTRKHEMSGRITMATNRQCDAAGAVSLSMSVMQVKR